MKGSRHDKGNSFVARFLRVAAWALATILLSSGCAASDTDRLIENISEQGFTEVFVSQDTAPGDYDVIVVIASQEHGSAKSGAVIIARTTWQTYPRDVDEFHIIINDTNALEGTKKDLVKMFGSRAIDARSPWIPFVQITIGAVALCAALLVWRRYRRLRKSRNYTG